MQQIKVKADALALLGNPFDAEDLTDVVLDGLTDEYKAIIEAIHGLDTPISFAELHEKLITRELAINTAARSTTQVPITALHAQNRNSNWRNHNNNNHSGNGSRQNNNNQRPSRPYLSRCQACGTQGHSVKNCPQFKLVSSSSQGQTEDTISTLQRGIVQCFRDMRNHLGSLILVPLIT